LFFEELASEVGLAAGLSIDNWRHLTTSQVLSKRVCVAWLLYT